MIKLRINQINKLKPRVGTVWNYSYYPVIFKTESDLLKLKEGLEHESINSRRYYYLSLEDLPYVSSNNCPVAEDISGRVLCLPLYVDLVEDSIKIILHKINQD